MVDQDKECRIFDINYGFWRHCSFKINMRIPEEGFSFIQGETTSITILTTLTWN